LAKRSNETHFRENGIYRTPPKTVAYMVGKILTGLPGGSVLDPAGGDGVFVQELIRQGIDARRVTAYDIDPEAVANLAQLTPNACELDFLESAGDERCPKFHAIIGNPPYNCHESPYVRANKNALAAKFSRIGVLNTYSMFLYAAINSLEEGGRLCFIVMDSLLTNTYHRNLRRFILDNCIIEELLLAPRKLFHRAKADVRTVIITLTRCSGPENADRRGLAVMGLIDRLPDESGYADPARVQTVRQALFERTEQNTFTIGVPEEVIDLFTCVPNRLCDFVRGGAGISTGNDSRFLHRRSEVGENSEYVPFYKNCAGRAYFCETDLMIERGYEKYLTSVPNFLCRNRSLYFREGVTCSSMGIRFSACYLPPGSLFGVNACFFPETRLELFYLLGFLNSKLASYLLRAVLNRSNMITPGYVKRLPYLPPITDGQTCVSQLAESITEKLRAIPQADYSQEQAEIDRLIFDAYGISEASRIEITDFCTNIMERL